MGAADVMFGKGRSGCSKAWMSHSNNGSDGHKCSRGLIRRGVEDIAARILKSVDLKGFLGCQNIVQRNIPWIARKLTPLKVVGESD